MKQIEADRVVRVWDLPTRLFHWLLVLSVSGALVTGLVTPTTWLDVHIYVGYTIFGLIIFRLVWGFFGGHFSRFRSFSYSPFRVIEHLQSLIRLRPQHYLGYNPSGSAMILLLFMALGGLTVTDWMVLGGENKQGFLSGIMTYATGHNAREVHEPLAYVLMVMVAVHIIGVAVESILTRQNLVGSMATGDKRVPVDMNVAATVHPRRLAASVCLLAIVLMAGPVILLLARMPPLGVPNIPMDSLYARECGDCHYAYSPSLLPESSWRGLMATLEDHFGEDATLEPSDRVKIEKWLVVFAAEHWDTRAANRFRAVSKQAPWEITATPYWQRKHRNIAKAVFAQNNVLNKGNCIAWHLDADTGRFDVQSVSIPEDRQSERK